MCRQKKETDILYVIISQEAKPSLEGKWKPDKPAQSPCRARRGEGIFILSKKSGRLSV